MRNFIFQFSAMIVLLQHQLFVITRGATVNSKTINDQISKPVISVINPRQMSANVGFTPGTAGIISDSAGSTGGGVSITGGIPQNTIESAGINLLRRGNGFLSNQVATTLDGVAVPLDVLQSLSNNGRLAFSNLGLSAQGLTNRLMTAGTNAANTVLQDIGTGLGGSTLISFGSGTGTGSRSANLQSGILPSFGSLSLLSGIQPAEGFTINRVADYRAENNPGLSNQAGFGLSQFQFSNPANGISRIFTNGNQLADTASRFRTSANRIASGLGLSGGNSGFSYGMLPFSTARINGNTVSSLPNENLVAGASSGILPFSSFNGNTAVPNNENLGFNFGVSPASFARTNGNTISSFLQNDLNGLMSTGNSATTGFPTPNDSTTTATLSSLNSGAGLSDSTGANVNTISPSSQNDRIGFMSTGNSAAFGSPVPNSSTTTATLSSLNRGASLSDSSDTNTNTISSSLQNDLNGLMSSTGNSAASGSLGPNRSTMLNGGAGLSDSGLSVGPSPRQNTLSTLAQVGLSNRNLISATIAGGADALNSNASALGLGLDNGNSGFAFRVQPASSASVGGNTGSVAQNTSSDENFGSGEIGGALSGASGLVNGINAATLGMNNENGSFGFGISPSSSGRIGGGNISIAAGQNESNEENLSASGVIGASGRANGNAASSSLNGGIEGENMAYSFGISPSSLNALNSSALAGNSMLPALDIALGN